MSLFIRNYDDDGYQTTSVTDMFTGDSVIVTAHRPDYDNVVDRIRQLVSQGSNLDEVRNSIQDTLSAEQKKKMENLRNKLGISINAHGEVTLPNGVSLPSGIAAIFSDIDDEEHAQRLIKFAQRLNQNPYEHAKESLVDWIMHNPSLKILEDGRIRGYRGLQENMTSIHSGYGIVNGEEVNDHLDNTPGNIIEFPSYMIDHNPSNYCSVGIHVGTEKYAVGFGQRYVTVAFAPEDVVSPPSDAAQEKIRVCKIEVLEEFFPTTHENYA